MILPSKIPGFDHKLAKTFLDNFHARPLTNQLSHGEVRVICKNCMEYLADCNCGPFMDPVMGLAELLEKSVG
ncbi:MAG: hypothetical protein IIB77_14170 [Proteobacteria bacterium]|nr:hypothetical protein [Pseudomonadota bacterium]